MTIPTTDMDNVCGVSNLDDRGYARSEARFPDHCDKRIGIWLNEADYPGSGVMGLNFEQFGTIYGRAMSAWNETVDLRLQFADRGEAICQVDFANLQGSTLAWSHLADNTCSRNKQQRYDHRHWGEHLLYLTALHELGHLIGLGHRNGNYIMNPTILTGLDGLTSHDITRARNLGYGAPTGPTPDPPPTPTPPPTPQPPDDPMFPWIELIEALLPIIKECIDRDGAKGTRRRLRDPGLVEYFRIRSAVRDLEDLRGKALRKRAREVFDRLENATPEEINQIIEIAEDG